VFASGTPHYRPNAWGIEKTISQLRVEAPSGLLAKWAIIDINREHHISPLFTVEHAHYTRNLDGVGTPLPPIRAAHSSGPSHAMTVGSL